MSSDAATAAREQSIAEVIHETICEESLSDHLDPGCPGPCVKAARAVLGTLDAPRRRALAESAAILRAFADARAGYLTPADLEPGAFRKLSASQQRLACEIDAYRKAANVIEDPIEAAQLTLPTWKLGEWPRTVAAIRAAAAEPGDDRG